jgi:hypothetical protein
MNFENVMRLIGRWGGTIQFFPSDPEARIGIAEEIVAMAANEEQVRWLVGFLPKIYRDWPGMLEVRAVFCTRYKPADGSEAALGTSSPAFAALCPDEAEAQKRLPGQRMIGGEVEPVTVDPEMRELIARCAAPRDSLRRAKSATDTEIAAIKRKQLENATEPETLLILTAEDN